MRIALAAVAQDKTWAKAGELPRGELQNLVFEGLVAHQHGQNCCS